MNLRLGSDGDLIIGRGASRVSGAEYVAQLAGNKLKTILGEWELDNKIGLPWFEDMLRHNYNLSTIYNWISATLLSIDDVVSIQDLLLTPNRETRNLEVSFTASTSYGGVSTIITV